MSAPKKLLVADDSLTIQKVIRLALSNEGYQIQAVSDGNDATQQILLFRPDIVLLDVTLPGKNAFEVKAWADEQGDFEETRFVLMSSAFEKVDEALVQRAAFHGRLTKPFDPANLRQVLSEMVAQVNARRQEPTSILQRPVLEEHPKEPSFDPIPVTDMDLEPLVPLKSGSMISIPESPISESVQIAGPAEDSSDIDIRSLTESTFRMSGLNPEEPATTSPTPPIFSRGKSPLVMEEKPLSDSGLDSEWSVHEKAKPHSGPALVGENTLTNLHRKEPSIPPPPNIMELSGTTLRMDALKVEHGAGPGSAYFGAPEDIEDRGSSGISLDPPSPPPPPKNPFAAGAPVSSDAAPSPLSSREMEEMLKTQLEAALQELARKILPEVAERVIKAEINKLLNERP